MFPSYIKKSILSGLTFFGTGILLSIAYATIGSNWTSPASLETTSGSTISSTAWNNLLANFNNLDARVTALSGTSGGLWEWQTWQNVTSSRSLNTWYQNTTSKPIMVYAHHPNSHNWAGVSFNVGASTSSYLNFQWPQNYTTDYTNTVNTVVVPAGWWYYITATDNSIDQVFELR